MTAIEEELRRHEEKVRRTKEFLMNEKNIEINRSNQALLNKLVEISTGKWSCVPRDRSADAGRQPACSFMSLNLPYRKKETERIERENHAFAKRLFERPANLSKKKLDNDYKEHVKFKKQIMKLGGSQKNALSLSMSQPATVLASVKKSTELVPPIASGGDVVNSTPPVEENWNFGKKDSTVAGEKTPDPTSTEPNVAE